jgi:hypothetical protein
MPRLKPRFYGVGWATWVITQAAYRFVLTKSIPLTMLLRMNGSDERLP